MTDYEQRRYEQQASLRRVGIGVAVAPFAVMFVVAALFAADFSSLVITLLTVAICCFMGFMGGILWQANR